MITITGSQIHTIEISKKQLAQALFQVVFEMIGDPDYDDAGCDWFTFGSRTYIADADWLVSTDYNVAVLVNAANVLLYGKNLTLKVKSE